MSVEQARVAAVADHMDEHGTPWEAVVASNLRVALVENSKCADRSEGLRCGYHRDRHPLAVGPSGPHKFVPPGFPHGVTRLVSAYRQEHPEVDASIPRATPTGAARARRARAREEATT